MYTIKSVIPFSLLVDTDMGLIKYIQFTCQGDDKYYPSIMEMTGPEHTEFLQCALIHRPFYNPLSAIMKKEKLITCNPDKVIDYFFSNYEEEILKLSTQTAIMDLICRSLFVADTLQFTVLCKSESEKKELIRRFKKHFNTSKVPVTIVVVDSLSEIDPRDYGNYYIKDIHELEEYKQPVEGKNILIARYDFNREFNIDTDEYMDLPSMEVIPKYMGNNKISFIDVYSMNIENSSVG